MDKFLNWPVFYRLVRVAFIAAVTQALVLQPDWSNPEVAFKTLAVAFAAGFLAALGKGIRETWGNDNPAKGLINRALPV